MNSAPVVSVVICLYNGHRYIAETLVSVAAQTFEDFEVIVVDDGSTDGSAEEVERDFAGRRLTVVRQANGGQGAALRTGITHARGEWIAFLDHDDLWAPRKLERQLATAASDPAAALLFSDCLLIDGEGEPLRRVSDQFDFGAIDLTGTHGYTELLRRGCFISMSTVLARTDAVRRVGGVNAAYRYALDYDLWLRLARLYPIRYVPEVLGRWRVHDAQFTQRHPEIALAEESAVLRPIFLAASFPRALRLDVGDYLFGRHRDCCRQLLRQRRPWQAVRAAAGIVRYPGRVADYCRAQASRTRCAPVVEAGVDRWLRARDVLARARAAVRQDVMRTLLRARRAPNKIRRILSGNRYRPATARAVAPGESTHVWIDGSPLADAQTGYFSLVSELVRTLTRQSQCIVHVRTPRSGRAALARRLGRDAEQVRFHPGGLELHIARFGQHRLPRVARLARFAWRCVPGPLGKPPHPDTIEVVFWRGRFRWRNSRHVAIVQDMTTRIHPELHTRENVGEFDLFLRYVQRHAHTIATISENSRRDIIERIAVYPDAVSVVPMPIHPRYRDPQVNAAIPRSHGISAPYVLCVGTIEPRKNLRRLVNAFELLKSEDAVRGHQLALVGPQGWDDTFSRFLVEHDAFPRIRRLGFVPTEDLPSLYRFASAVIYPSLYEGFGLPVLEGMCCSGFVLASRISSLPAVLGDDGLFFDPYSTADIARALLQALMMDEREASEYRRTCRRRAESLLERSTRVAPLPGLRETTSTFGSA